MLPTNYNIKNELCTDYKLYKSIFFHLMTNACKYSPPNGQIKLIFTYEPSNHNEGFGYLKTIIEDEGTGFDAKKYLSNVFKTFQ